MGSDRACEDAEVEDELLESHSLRSAPAQKLRPTPVKMAQRKPGSASNHRNTRSSSLCVNVSRQLRDEGRLMVMRRVEAVGKERSVFLRGVPVDIL